MTSLEKNIIQFNKCYDFKKRNYNIIVHSPDATGKYIFIVDILKNYFHEKNIRAINQVESHPDVFYLSLPLYNKSGKMERVVNNDERLIYEFGLADKFDNFRVGTDIVIDQIRELREFTDLSPRYDHKFVIINNCNYLNHQSSAALLKTLEETNSPCIFLLLASELQSIKDTIRSRCHTYQYIYENKDTSYKTYFDYYFSMKPGLKNIYDENEYLNNYNLFENELSSLYKKEINPLSLSGDWMDRGSLCIDYLLSLFYILMKGFAFDSENNLTGVYQSLSKKLPIKSSRSINIIRLLHRLKKDSRGNLNKKLFYDNLLIVLDKELY